MILILVKRNSGWEEGEGGGENIDKMHIIWLNAI